MKNENNTIIFEKIKRSNRTLILFFNDYRELIGVNFYEGLHDKPMPEYMNPDKGLTDYVIDNLLELWQEDALCHPNLEYNNIKEEINALCDWYLESKLVK